MRHVQHTLLLAALAMMWGCSSSTTVDERIVVAAETVEWGLDQARDELMAARAELDRAHLSPQDDAGLREQCDAIGAAIFELRVELHRVRLSVDVTEFERLTRKLFPILERIAQVRGSAHATGRRPH